MNSTSKSDAYIEQTQYQGNKQVQNRLQASRYCRRYVTSPQHTHAGDGMPVYRWIRAEACANGH